MPRVLLAAALLMSASAAAAQEEPLHPLAADVAAKLEKPGEPFVMLLEFEPKPGREDAFLAAIAEPRKMTVKEPGNLAYALSRVAGERGDEAEEGEPEEVEFVLYEHWKSLGALDAHLKQPYLVKFLGEVGELLSSDPEVTVCVPAAAE